MKTQGLGIRKKHLQIGVVPRGVGEPEPQAYTLSLVITVCGSDKA